MQKIDPVVEMIRAHFPNVARNINRDNAPIAMKQMVAHMSHEVMQENSKEGHNARQRIRDEIFAQIAQIAQDRKKFGI